MYLECVEHIAHADLRLWRQRQRSRLRSEEFVHGAEQAAAQVRQVQFGLRDALLSPKPILEAVLPLQMAPAQLDGTMNDVLE